MVPLQQCTVHSCNSIGQIDSCYNLNLNLDLLNCQNENLTKACLWLIPSHTAGMARLWLKCQRFKLPVNFIWNVPVAKSSNAVSSCMGRGSKWLFIMLYSKTSCIWTQFQTDCLWKLKATDEPVVILDQESSCWLNTLSLHTLAFPIASIKAKTTDVKDIFWLLYLTFCMKKQFVNITLTCEKYYKQMSNYTTTHL